MSKRIFVSKKTHFEMSFTKLRLYFHGPFVLSIALSPINSKLPSGKYLPLRTAVSTSIGNLAHSYNRIVSVVFIVATIYFMYLTFVADLARQ